MSLLTTTNNSQGIFRPDHGRSQEAEGLKGRILAIFTGLENRSISRGWRNALRDEVQTLHEDCAVENWDGEGALPITIDVASRAKRIVDLLPEGIISPDVVSVPNGQIMLEWIGSRNIMLNVMISGEKAVYAGILGRERPSGQWTDLDNFSNPLARDLRAYFLSR